MQHCSRKSPAQPRMTSPWYGRKGTSQGAKRASGRVVVGYCEPFVHLTQTLHKPKAAKQNIKTPRRSIPTVVMAKQNVLQQSNRQSQGSLFLWLVQASLNIVKTHLKVCNILAQSQKSKRLSKQVPRLTLRLNSGDFKMQRSFFDLDTMRPFLMQRSRKMSSDLVEDPTRPRMSVQGTSSFPRLFAALIIPAAACHTTERCTRTRISPFRPSQHPCCIEGSMTFLAGSIDRRKQPSERRS